MPELVVRLGVSCSFEVTDVEVERDPWTVLVCSDHCLYDFGWVCRRAALLDLDP